MTMRQRTIFWIGANMYYAIIDFFLIGGGGWFIWHKMLKNDASEPKFFSGINKGCHAYA